MAAQLTEAVAGAALVESVHPTHVGHVELGQLQRVDVGDLVEAP